MAIGDVLFWVGIGLVGGGLVWRSRLRRPGESPRRRPFLTSPRAPIFLGILVAIWGLYAAGDL